jgi:phenylacetate-CoA ligase
MHRIMGRTDDMLIVRGVNIFPSQVEQVLLKIDGVEPHYQILVDRKGALDYLEVRVEMNETLFSDEIRYIEIKEKEIEHALKEELLVYSKVKLVEPRSIERSEGKAKRVVDVRNI